MSKTKNNEIADLRARLAAAETACTPNHDARDLDKEADRITRAKALAELLRGRLDAAIKADRTERGQALRAELADVRAKRNALFAEADGHDAAAVESAAALFHEDFRGRIADQLRGRPSEGGAACRVDAARLESRESEIEFELKSLGV